MTPNFLQKYISGVKITINHHWRRAFSHFAANISCIVMTESLTNSLLQCGQIFITQSNGQTSNGQKRCSKKVIQTW